jgi:hypothetical protein
VNKIPRSGRKTTCYPAKFWISHLQNFLLAGVFLHIYFSNGQFNDGTHCEYALGLDVVSLSSTSTDLFNMFWLLSRNLGKKRSDLVACPYFYTTFQRRALSLPVYVNIRRLFKTLRTWIQLVNKECAPIAIGGR